MHIKNIKSKICISALSLILVFGAIFGIVRLVDLASATSAGNLGLVDRLMQGTTVNYGGNRDTSQYEVVYDADHEVITNHAMCAMPSKDNVVEGRGTIYGFSPSGNSTAEEAVKVLLATDSNYGSSAYGGTLGQDIADLVSGANGGSGIRINSSPSLSATMFAVGHMVVGVVLSDLTQESDPYFGLNVNERAVVDNIRATISNWYSANSGVTDWQGYDLMLMAPNNTSYQAVTWLEPNGGSVDPDPDPDPTVTTVVINKYRSDTGAGLSGATFEIIDGTTNAVVQTVTMTGSNYTYTPTSTSGAWCVREKYAPSGFVIGASGGLTCKTDMIGGQTLTFNVYNDPDTPTPTTGTIKIYKEDENGNGLAGAKFYLATEDDKNNGNTSAYQTIDMTSTDTVTLSDVEEDTWCLKEIQAPTGYQMGDYADWQCYGLGAGGTLTFRVTNTPIKGGISITKQRKINTENDGAMSSTTQAFSGISFGVYSGSDLVTTITTGADGVAKTDNSTLPYGTYTIKEVSNNNNAAFDKISDQSVTVSSNGTIVDAGTFVDELLDNPTLSTIARESSSTADDPVKQLPITTNASITDRIIYNTLTTGLDYKVCGQVYTVASKTLLTATPVCTSWTQADGGTEVDVVFTGIDATKAIGDSVSIVQRLYVVNNGEDLLLAIHNADLTDVNETLTVEGVGITTSAASLRTGNDKTLTPGIVTIVDTVTAVGLEKDKVYHLRASLVDQDGNAISLSRSDEDNGSRITIDYTMMEESGTTVYPQVNIEFNAANYVGKKVTVYEELYDDEMNLLADHKQLGETSQTLEVVVPTIETVAWRTGAVGSSKEIYVSARAGISDVVSMTNLTPGAGYILRGEIYEVSDDGALVSTTPLVTSDDKTFTVGANTETAAETVEFNLNTTSLVGKKLVVYEYLYYGSTKIAEHTEPADADQTVTVATLGISTEAWRSDAIASSKDIYISKEAQVTDVVSMVGLTEGTDYTLRGEIYELTGEGASATIGANPLASETVYFRASDSTGEESAEMTFTIDTTELIGKKLVVFERLYIDDALIAEHTDKNDSSQIVTVMTLSIATSAWRSDAVGVEKSIYVNKQAKATDVVTMVGLTEGTGYTLQGELYEMITTGAVTTIGDTPVATATKSFTGQGNLDGERVNVEFTADTTELAGKRLIVYEKLYIGDTLVASHEDITDPEQVVTVMAPSIETEAVDASDNDAVMDAVAGQAITDTVTYRNLQPGENYYLCGALMDKNTGNVLKIDGVEVSEKCETKTADDDGAGNFTMTFAVDASKLPGASVVVYESLYLDNTKATLIASHRDLTDGNQTVKVRPMVGTKAVDKYDNDQEVGVGEVGIADTVAYAGIGAGTYTMRGQLIDIDAAKESDKETGITAESTFTITDADLVDGLASGEMTMTFELNTKKYVGHRLVVFEELYLTAEPDMLVAEHKDESDTDQTVTVMVPEIQTMATDGLDEDKTVLPDTKVTIKDRVAYTGLAPGTTYTLKGVLMDKETGKILVLGDGKEAPEGVLVFEAGRDDGVVRMEFDISTVELAGKDIVVFETLYLGEEVEEEVDAETGEVITEGVELGEDDIIAKHEDIDDANQTVTVGSPVKVPDTGFEQSINADDGSIRKGSLILVVFVAGTAMIATGLMSKRKNVNFRNKM